MTDLPQLILEGIRRHPEAREATTTEEALDAMGLTGQVIRASGFTSSDIDTMMRYASSLEALAVPGVPELVLTMPPEAATSLNTKVRSRFSRTRVAVNRLIRHATDSVIILAPYCHPGVVPDLAGALASAHINGAALRIVVQEDDAWDVRPFARKIMSAVPTVAVDLIPSSAPRTHAKVVIIDDVAAYVGSGNLTPHGYGWNFEAGLITRGPHVAALGHAVECYLETTGLRPLSNVPGT